MTAIAAARSVSSRRPLRTITTALAALAATPAARGAEVCVDARERPLQAIEAVRVVADGFPPAVAPAVARAMAMWNAPECNTGGFPLFRAQTDEPHRVLRVLWIEGTNPHVEGSCGNFSGNQVLVYSHARDPRDGGIRSCGTVARIAETLAHELGHALGLEDQYGPECDGYIMGQLVRTRGGAVRERRVRAAECAAADRWFLTLAERGGWSGADRLAAAPDAAAGAGVRPPAGAAGSPPRSARTAPGIPATGSDGFRP